MKYCLKKDEIIQERRKKSKKIRKIKWRKNNRWKNWRNDGYGSSFGEEVEKKIKKNKKEYEIPDDEEAKNRTK